MRPNPARGTSRIPWPMPGRLVGPAAPRPTGRLPGDPPPLNHRLRRSRRSPPGCLPSLPPPGSRKTQAARRGRLRALGFSDADLARIHGPVGLPIGARSTGEIAVSILSQVVAALHGAVVHLIDLVKGAGVTRFALHVEPEPR